PAEPRKLDLLARHGARWAFDLEKRSRIDPDDPPVRPREKPAGPLSRTRQMAFHPVVVGNQVLVADSRCVTAYDAKTGEATVWYAVTRTNAALDTLLDAKLPARPDPAYTLTVAEDCVFARLGVLELGGERKPQDAISYLVCLELKPGKNAERVRWEVRADEG